MQTPHSNPQLSIAQYRLLAGDMYQLLSLLHIPPVTKPGYINHLFLVLFGKAFQLYTIDDLIKERNKLTQPVQKTPDTPFFLPTNSGINPVFVASGAAAPDDDVFATVTPLTFSIPETCLSKCSFN